MELMIVLLLAVVFLLALLSAFLFFYYWQINKAIAFFLENGKVKDAKDVLLAQVKRTQEVENEMAKMDQRMKLLEEIAKVSLQKIGVVRFNPFGDMGGNQSFIIALLDNENNGFVISSFFIKEGSRVYAKPVVDGKSDHALSAEENDAIARAMNRESQQSKK